MATKKRTTKLTTDPTAAASAAPEAPARTAIKVLRGGHSWHGGDHAWSLPTRQPDGAWSPGDWTRSVAPMLCSAGWHLTARPVAWWGDGVDVVAYLAEHDGEVSGPCAEAIDDPTKFSAERCRLLRPLTHAELEAHGIYLTGTHEEISGGRAIVGGDARVKRVTGTARIDRMTGTARIDRMTGTARIDWMDGTARIDRMDGTARIDRMDGTARIDWMTGTARIDWMTGTARIDWMTGTARIDWMDGTARIDWMTGTARIDRMTGTARIDRMTGTARIDWMDGTARIDRMTGTATAHASGEALVVVRHARPVVTVRGRASSLDYRPQRPVLHLADAGMVLTLAAGGDTSQLPEAEHDRLATERAAVTP